MRGSSAWEGSPDPVASRTPVSQPAANGALDIFVDGHRHGDVSKMLFGLTLLRDASPARIEAAIAVVQARHHLGRAEIESMLAA